MQSIADLKQCLEQRNSEIDSAVSGVLLQAQQERVIEDVKGLLAYVEQGQAVAVAVESQRAALMQKSSVEALKEALFLIVKEYWQNKCEEIKLLPEKTLEDRQALMSLEEALQNSDSLKAQINEVEAPGIDSIVDKAAKVDHRYWVLISDGKQYLYDTKAIGYGENGSVHAAINLATGVATECVIKLQYGRMDITEFVTTGERFKDEESGIEGQVLVANGQRYVLADDWLKKNTGPQILETEGDREYIGFSDPIFLEKIDGGLYNFEFIAQSGSVVAKEHEKSANYQVDDKPLGIAKAEVYAPNREFLDHVVPLVAEPAADANTEQQHKYLVKMHARELLLDKISGTPVFALVQKFVDGDSLDRLIDPEKQLLVSSRLMPELQARDAIEFVMKLLDSTKSLRSTSAGGSYHTKDSAVHGIYHRDIRPGNIKRKTNGEIEFIDLGAATDYEEDRVATAKMGQTERYTHPEIIAAIAANLGREVNFAFAERHEAFSMARVIEDYLTAVMQQNPAAKGILEPIIQRLNAHDWQSFEEMSAFAKTERANIKPPLPPRKVATKGPATRPVLGMSTRPVSEKIAGIMEKLKAGFTEPAEIKQSKIVSKDVVQKLAINYSGGKKPVAQVAQTKNEKKKEHHHKLKGRGHDDSDTD